MARFKYPKLLILIFTFILAYEIFSTNELLFFRTFVYSSGYFGVFLAGLLFSYGFTTAIAIAMFLIISPGNNLWFTGIIGGLGALLSDFLIFKIIRSSFKDEIIKLEKEEIIKDINHAIPRKIKHYIVAIFAGIILASPLPDEIGVFLLAASSRISQKVFVLISYLFNTLGILVILLIGRAI